MKNTIFFKKANKIENQSNYLKQKILRNMPDKEGYNKVYMPYGGYEKGFYYVKQEDIKAEEKAIENEKNSEMEKQLLQLYKELKKEYPTRHYLHSRVFNNFWNLVNALNAGYLFDK